jgi:hypothetical protein
MRPFAIALRLLAIAFIATASLHLVYGLKADAMLGAQVPAEMVHKRIAGQLESILRNHFSMLGVALFVAVTDLRRYRPIVVANLAVSFAAGLARIVSWALYGSVRHLCLIATSSARLRSRRGGQPGTESTIARTALM